MQLYESMLIIGLYTDTSKSFGVPAYLQGGKDVNVKTKEKRSK